MMISATELNPSFCLDCLTKLPKPEYGRLVDKAKETSGIRPYAVRMAWDDSYHIVCPCGCIYMWAYDETNFNGGIWKRRHILPLFDDSARIEISVSQIRKHLKLHFKTYSPELLEQYKRRFLT